MNNAEEARRMLRAHRYGALSTLSKKFDGFPFGSITPYLVDHDGSLLILISALAEHTKNIQHDPRISLITHDQRSPHIQTQGRVTVVGTAHLANDKEQAGGRYLRHFPEAQSYFSMHDFSFYRIQPIAIRFIGGFGRIHWVNMENYAIPEAEAFAQQEAQSIAQANALPKDALRRLLEQHYPIDAADAEIIGADCDGLDARCGEQVWRLDFPESIHSPAMLPQALAALFSPAE